LIDGCIYFMDEGVKVRMQEPNFNSSTPPTSQEQEPEQKTEQAQARAQARLLDKMASNPPYQTCDGTDGTSVLGGHVAGRTCK
jgi:hypothetical protein